VEKLSTRFREGYRDKKTEGLIDEGDQPLLLPEYHRRIPADGFPVYAEGVWDQIVHNKDLDLPTQQELLAQFRCDEIAREVLVLFDETVAPLEAEQVKDAQSGTPSVISDLGNIMNLARSSVLKNFETEASRYHKGVYSRKRTELEENVDKRLKDLFQGQLSAAHKAGIKSFSDSVSAAVKLGQKKGAQYDFAQIVDSEKKRAYTQFESVAAATAIEGASWSSSTREFVLFKKELDQVSSQLRKEEMRRLATRVERWVRSRLGESIGLEFNKLGSGRGGSGAPAEGSPHTSASEKEIWDRIWSLFTSTVSEAEARFTERAKSYDASPEEVEVGLWRLRRKSWGVLRAKIEEETSEGNIGMKLRENFEDRFRYDDHGVPRVWRPSDDIDGLFARARDHTLTLIPLLSRFKLSATSGPPPLDEWIGTAPESVTTADEEDLAPIGGVDEEEGKSLEEEMTVFTDSRIADVERRFRKTADSVYVDAKRGALGGVRETPWWMWGLLVVLGQNEIFAGKCVRKLFGFFTLVHYNMLTYSLLACDIVARNPFLILLLALSLAGLYITYTLNLWGPILRMSNTMYSQAMEIAKEKLREFLESSDAGRQAIAMSGSENQARRVGDSTDGIKMATLDGEGKRVDEEEDEI
jgi:hypothetical protein